MAAAKTRALPPVGEAASLQLPKAEMPQFSYFQGPISNTRPVTDGPIRLIGLWYLITGTRPENNPDGYPQLRQRIETLRAAPPLVQDHLKRALDYVTPAGIFTPSRANANFQVSSGLLVLDFDDLPDVSAARATLLADLELGPDIALLFVSPSGTGLKAFVRLDLAHSYADNFDAVAAYLRHTYPALQLALDAKCRDVSRACFLSHDPDAYLHPDYHRAPCP